MFVWVGGALSYKHPFLKPSMVTQQSVTKVTLSCCLISKSPLEGLLILQEFGMQRGNSLFQEFVLLCELLGLLVQFHEN